MSRLVAIVLLGSLAFAFSPATAHAQFRGVFAGPSPLYIYGNGSGGYGYGLALNFGIAAPSPYGPVGLGYIAPYNISPVPYGAVPSWSGGYGYVTGGSYTGGINTFGAQMDLAAGQQAATKARKNQEEARDLIDAQWAYEKLGANGQVAVKGSQDQDEELQKALVIKDPSEVASGAALNRILVAIVVAEGKGAKGVAAFLPPQLLEDVRFSGGPSADLLNLVRQSGKLPFPAGLMAPNLAAFRVPLEADFAAAIAPLKGGRSADPTKVTKLEATLKKLDDAAPPVIRNLSFDDALAAERFLDQFNSAIKALKGPNLAGLINSKWATDGISVTDLVKHMTRYKLMFGPAPIGSEGSYLSLHKALATYLFVLSQAKK